MLTRLAGYTHSCNLSQVCLNFTSSSNDSSTLRLDYDYSANLKERKALVLLGAQSPQAGASATRRGMINRKHMPAILVNLVLVKIQAHLTKRY